MLDDAAARRAETFDDITADLRDLRADAGYPSYSDLVLTIARRREARGVPPSAARPGRTTVYDAFRAGRTRLDAQLVGEIAEALGASEQEVEVWRERCRSARRALEVPAAEVAAEAEPQAEPEVEPQPDVEPQPGATEPLPPPSGRHPLLNAALLVVVGLLVNLLGRALVHALGIPLHLDMVGTAIAALAAGPWTGVAVAVLSSGLGVGLGGPVSAAFMPVNILGALMWGYGYHRFGLGSSLRKFFMLTLTTALACSLLAAPILLLLGGSVGHGGDATLHQLEALTGNLAIAVFITNLIYSVADKVISAFVALAVVDVAKQEPMASGRKPKLS